MKKLLVLVVLFIGVHSFAQAVAPTPANVGDKVTMTVTASGTQPLTYAWFKDGKVIPNQSASTYIIPVVALTDAGNYTAQASNSAGSYTSNAPSALVVSLAVTPPSGTTITITVTPAPKP